MRATPLALGCLTTLVAACTDHAPYTIDDPDTSLAGLAIKDTVWDDVTALAGREAVTMPGVELKVGDDDLYEPDEPTIVPAELGYRVRLNDRLAYDVHVTTPEHTRSAALELAEVRVRWAEQAEPAIRTTLVLIAREPGVAEVDAHVLLDGVNQRNGGSLTITVVAP